MGWLGRWAAIVRGRFRGRARLQRVILAEALWRGLGLVGDPSRDGRAQLRCGAMWDGWAPAGKGGEDLGARSEARELMR